jgi:hypothetical protein
VCSNRSTSDVRNTQTKNKEMATVSVRVHAHALGSRLRVGWCMDRVLWSVEDAVRAQQHKFFSCFFLFCSHSHLMISFFGRFISTEGASSTAPPSALPTAAPSLATLLAVSLPLAATAVMARSFLGAA